MSHPGGPADDWPMFGRAAPAARHTSAAASPLRRHWWAAVVVALAVLAAGVGFWSLTRGDEQVQAAPLPSPSPTGSPPPGSPGPPATPVPAVTAATESITSVPEPEQVVDSAMTVELPSLGTTAPVIEVGVTAERVLQVPGDPAVLGRWADGARPGDGTGSVVLAGHVSYRGELGVLHTLPDLQPGDEAVVTTSQGQARYRAERVDVYRKAALPYQDIFQFDVPERLVLITCGGEFDRATGHYDSNVVAYLTRV
ncbi:MAG: class F sortase [Kineosporiaceae bacterium]